MSVVVFTLMSNIVIGLPMAVIPIFVHSRLGFSTILAGFAVSLQYLATFAVRSWTGRMVDRTGAKQSVLAGLVATVLSGVLTTISGLVQHIPWLSLATLLGSRLLLGLAESLISIGVMVWNIERAGPARTAQVISWNGICSYGGIALGAPLGAVMALLPGLMGGVTTLGMVSVLVGLVGLGLCRGFPPVVRVAEPAPPIPFARVLLRVLPYGTVLALGSLGFGAISSCLALYYTAHNWNGAAAALSIFGASFVAVRLVFSREINRRGGSAVALVSLTVETMGLGALWLAPTSFLAGLATGLTGAGLSLVFPALGVDAVARVGPENRGAALGAFAVFFDVALGLSGPLLGLVIQSVGYDPLFGVCAVLCAIGVAMLIVLRWRLPSRRPPG
ncbi:MFS transporter [Ameyamaea chiangmaiensis]|uniref:MFS transporter n=2 Tax=Ameyamaea chiangmaiensis TaxID=442969 RepID=A0A850PAK5_9PROT|nr:MFS transporter [Ameyamaea chiangmaiensis]NVN39729.1 MFS transporter [Ameyamaea chiangmaiensis]